MDGEQARSVRTDLEIGAGEHNLTGGARNEWDIRLNDEVPTTLSVQMGAGESDLDFDSLTLRGWISRWGRVGPR